MKNKILEHITIEEIAAEGKSLFKHEGKVFFIKNTIPGDIVTTQIIKNKKNWGEAILINIETPSTNRITPFCKHFGVCGGCKWQMLPYNQQIQYKQNEVLEQFKRIAKIDTTQLNINTIASQKNTHYRNKLEFAFSNKTYLNKDQIADKNVSAYMPALGFHTNKIFDKIIPIQECYLMDAAHNTLRNSVYNYCVQQNLSFYDRRTNQGLMRNMVIKMTTTNEVLINIIFGEKNANAIHQVMDYIFQTFPTTSSLYYTINEKLNDTIYDLQPILYKGKNHITEKIQNFLFDIGPKSFFQTNTFQAEKLYQQVADYAQLNGTQNVLDLYCGVGSIGIFLSKQAKQVMGIEIIAEAIEDAKQNALKNNINNISFVQGDIEKMVKQKYFDTLNFAIDVLILDPPRNGLSANLLPVIKQLAAKKIIYVSCNASTQARDLEILLENYSLDKASVIDMFPHTPHIETVVQLTHKK